MIGIAWESGGGTMTDSAELYIVEGDKVRRVGLDGRPRWTMGRATPDCIPDIPLSSPVAGRTQGQLLQVGSSWFYCDGGSLNGTFCRGKRLGGGRNIHPIMLEDGDILSIGPGGKAAPVWLLFKTGKERGGTV